jgi:hypothetical protein
MSAFGKPNDDRPRVVVADLAAPAPFAGFLLQEADYAGLIDRLPASAGAAPLVRDTALAGR